MNKLRLISMCFVSTAVLFACTDKTTDSNSGPSTLTNAEGNDENDTDGQENEESAESGMEMGDGDGDPGSTTVPSFVPDNDVIGVSECDPWTQDCPEGEKCVAYGSTGGNWDANKCVTIMGDGQPGDPCVYNGTTESTDDCGAESWCWNVNEEGMGTCTPFCTGTPDDPICDQGFGCSIANNGSITLCLLQCDPLLQDCPTDGNSCFYDFSGNFVCAFETQNLAEGETCGFINDCAGGNICLAADVLPSCAGASCCSAFCDLADPTCAIMGTECSDFFEPGTAPPGYEDVGVCIIPGA